MRQVRRSPTAHFRQRMLSISIRSASHIRWGSNGGGRIGTLVGRSCVHFSIEERLCLLGAYEGQIRRTSLEAARGAALLSQGGAVRSAVRLRSSASSSTINTARRFCCACPTAGFPLLAFVVIGIQSAHERRQPSRERGRNDVGECCPQFARKSSGGNSFGRVVPGSDGASGGLFFEQEPPLAHASLCRQCDRAGFVLGRWQRICF